MDRPPVPRHSILSPTGIVIAVIVGATASGWTSGKLVEGWQWMVARAFETGSVAIAASLVSVVVLIIGVGLQIAAIAHTHSRLSSGVRSTLSKPTLNARRDSDR
ncbi:hypothetical protein A5N83_03050 [Rhodococcus sp. 1139]|nr:hypothetical protein A5N83_03050 [Rhodococcus sp. 1139]